MPNEQTLVSATSVDTGRFTPVEQLVDRGALISLLDQLFTVDQGYVEIRRVDDYFPVLLVGFRRGLAVAQCMSNPDSMSVLAGDGSVPGSELVEVLIMDDLASFGGEYVVASPRALDILLEFASGADVYSLGDWHEL